MSFYPESGHLPTAQTCFSSIELPDYADEATFHRKLELSLEHMFMGDE